MRAKVHIIFLFRKKIILKVKFLEKNLEVQNVFINFAMCYIKM